MGEYIFYEFWLGLLKKENELGFVRMRISLVCDVRVNIVVLFCW